MYIYMYVFIYLNIYIYICLCVCMCIYVSAHVHYLKHYCLAKHNILNVDIQNKSIEIYALLDIL